MERIKHVLKLSDLDLDQVRKLVKLRNYFEYVISSTPNGSAIIAAFLNKETAINFMISTDRHRHWYLIDLENSFIE